MVKGKAITLTPILPIGFSNENICWYSKLWFTNGYINDEYFRQ